MTLLSLGMCSSKRRLIQRQTKFLILLFLVFNSFLFGEDTSKGDEKVNLGYKEALIFGIVEGVTEFLPISSTGHLILVNQWLSPEGDLEFEEEQAIYAYLIIIQAGAILAVGIIYFSRIQSVLLGFFGLNQEGKLLGINLFLAFLPAALVGPFLDEVIEALLFGQLPIAFALIIGSFLMAWAENKKKIAEKANVIEKKNLAALSWKNALMIGILQCVAMCPGTSRSMMTIVGGYLAGLSRAKAAEFSFLLGLLTLSAAAGYKALTKQETLTQNLEVGPALFGCLVAGIFAALSVRWLVRYLSRHGLGVFIYYRIILGIVVLGFYFFH